MPDGVTNIMYLIQKKIVERENELAVLNKVLGDLTSAGRSHRDTAPFVSPHQFSNKPVGVCIREYLELKRWPSKRGRGKAGP